MTTEPMSTNGTGSNQPAKPWRVVDTSDENAMGEFHLELDDAVAACPDCQVTAAEFYETDDNDIITACLTEYQVKLCPAHQYLADGELVTEYTYEVEEITSAEEIRDSRIEQLEELLSVARLAQENMIREFISQMNPVIDAIVEMQVELMELYDA